MIDANSKIAPGRKPGMHNILRVVLWGGIVTATLWIALMASGFSTLSSLFVAWLMSGVTTLGVAGILAFTDGFAKREKARLSQVEDGALLAS
ncbi:MAG: hypothetical protein AAGD13_09285 [Pseudomonadota bacterium]